MTDPRGNTDPLTFVSVGQDPNHTPGWNSVTLSNGEVWKYAGVVERNENGFIVQCIALTDNNTGEIGPDGPIITPEVALAIQAVGGEIPAIHATKVVPPAPAASSPVPSAVPVGAPLPANHVAVHESWFWRLEAALKDDAVTVKTKVAALFALVKAKL